MALENQDWLNQFENPYTGGEGYQSPQVPTPDTGKGIIPESPEIPSPVATKVEPSKEDWLAQFEPKQGATTQTTTGIPTPKSEKVSTSGQDWLKQFEVSVPSPSSFTIETPPPAPTEPTLIGEAGKGIVGGLHDIKSMAGGALAMGGKVVGLPGIENVGKEWMEAAKKSSEPYTPAVASFRDIKDVGDVGLYLTHGLARMLPTMAATLIPGGAAGIAAKGLGIVSKLGQAAMTVAGGMAGSLPLEVGQIVQQQLDAGQELDPKKSLWAIPAALLDVLPQAHALARLGIIDRLFGAKGIEGIAKAGAPGFFSKNIFGRMAKQAGIQFAEEAPTEGAQAILERWGAGNYKFDKEALDDFVNSFILGGITGGVFGGLGGILPERRSTAAPVIAPPVEEPTVTPGIPGKEEWKNFYTQQGFVKGTPEQIGVSDWMARAAAAPTVTPAEKPEEFTHPETRQAWKDFLGKFGVDETQIKRYSMVDFLSEAMGINPQGVYDASTLNSKFEILPRVGSGKQGILQLVTRDTGEPVLEFTENPDSGKFEVASVFENGRKISVENNQMYQQTLNIFKDALLPNKSSGKVEMIRSVTASKPVVVPVKTDITKPGVVEATKNKDLLPLSPNASAAPETFPGIPKEHQVLIDKYGVDEFMRRAGNMEFGDQAFVTATQLAEANAKESPGFGRISGPLTRYVTHTPEEASTVSPSVHGSDAGTEAAFRRDYAGDFGPGGFADRSYWYAPGQKVEPRFQGRKTAQAMDLNIFDPKTATKEESLAFGAKVIELRDKFRTKYGENFGNLPQQAQEIDYASARDLGYDGLNQGDHVGVFKEVPRGMGRTQDEWQEPKVRGIGRGPKLLFQDVANYTMGINKKINTNLVEFVPIDTMKELQGVLSKNYGYDLAEGSHFQDYTIKDPKTGKWTIYLIREELPRYQAMDTAAWHGASGHVGVELLMGKEADNFFDKVFSKFLHDNPQKLMDISESYKISPETLAGRRKIAREAFAFFSETNPRHGLVQEFIAMFRRWLRVVFPSIALSDTEIISVAMKSRELVTSNLDATTVNIPYVYRNYSKFFAKPTSEIVISRSFQGADKSALIGPNDVQYVARDQVSGDSGRIIITAMDNGFVLKQLEVDPGYMKSGVIDRLLLNAVNEHGALMDINDPSVKNRMAVEKVISQYPEIYGDNQVMGLNRIGSEIDDDRIFAAKKIGVRPEQLDYVGKQEMIDEYMHLWNVNDPGGPLDGSTRTGEKYPMKNNNLGMPRVVLPEGEGAIPGATPDDATETGNHGSWALWVDSRKGRNSNFGNQVMKDMGIHEYIWQLPHWVAMKYKEFAGVVNVEWERIDKMNKERLDLTQDPTSTPTNRVDNLFVSLKDASGVEKLVVYSDAENTFLKDNRLQDKAQELLGRQLTQEEITAYNTWKQSFDRAKGYIVSKARQILEARMMSDRIGQMVWASLNGDTTISADALNEKDQKHFKDLSNEYQLNIGKIEALKGKLDAINFYMPRIRERGDYVVRVSQMTEDGQTKTIFADRRASPTEAEKLRIQLSEDPRFQGMKIVKSKETVTPEFLFEGLNQAKVEAFLGRAVDRAVRKEGLSSNEAQSVMDSIYDSVTNEILARGFRERYMGRSKEGLIEGYKTEDLKSVFMTYMTGLAGSMNKLEATFNFHEALKGIDKNQQKNLFEYASRYINDMLRNSDNVTRMVNKAKTLPYAWYLMANLRMVVAQLFQNYVQGSAVMSRYIKEAPLQRGGKSGILRTERAMRDIITGNLTDNEKIFMDRAFNEGETMAKLINEMKGRAESGWAKKIGRVVDILSIPFSKMETINRQTAILAMFRLGMDQGMGQEGAYFRAKQFVRDVHYAYGKSNMPQLLRDGTTFAQIGGGAYTFRSFTHNFILSMVHYARNAEGKLALDVVGRTLAWTVLLGGLGAAPFLDEILDELEKLTGVPYRSKMRAALKGAGGEVLAQAGMSGLPTLLGVDMSGTMKITPGIPLLGSGSSGSLWGVWGGLGQKALDAVNFTANGNWARAVESASPAGIEALGKAFRGSTEGVRGKGNKLVVDETGRPVYLTGGEAARQAAGFRPARVAELSGERRVEANVEKYFTDKRQDIYAKARTARTSSDWESIARDVTAFNIKAAPYRGVISTISAQSIRESLKTNKRFPKYEQSIQAGS